MPFQNGVIILAVFIILVLTIWAGRLQYLLYQQKKRQALVQLQQDNLAREERERVNKSIQILARAVQGEELTLTEASIRISVLLDTLDVSDNVRTEFSAFYQLRERTSHIPILAAWKNLDRKQQKEFEIERLRYETTFGDFVIDAAKRIESRNF
jgi:K+ transporter